MILTVTLNPAVDKTYQTEELFCGRVNRMRSVTNIPGGKGINVARILNQYGENVTATGFLGGFPGKWIDARIREMGINSDFIEVDGETRSSMNVVADNGYVTEILEPGPNVTAEDLEVFCTHFSELVKEASMVVLSGSAAPGIPEDIYARLIREASEAGKETILDTSGELLRQGIKAAPAAVKPNRKELEYLIGHRLRDKEDLKAAAGLLLDSGVKMVVISLGDKGLLLMNKEHSLYAKAPKVKADNTVGCGDSVVASFVMSIGRGDSEEEMLRRAAAISAASATTFESGFVPMELAEEFYEEIVVEEI